MISFVVENFTNAKLVKKTPRYKLKVTLLKSGLVSNMLKLISYNVLNVKNLDNFFSYFMFTRTLNKSTISVNLSLGYYYKSLITTNKHTSRKLDKILNNFNFSIYLLGLPISFKVNNFIFFYTTLFNLNYYSPFYLFYNHKYHYINLPKLLNSYNNLNYYYLKVYEH